MRGDNTLSPLRFVCLEEQSPPRRTLPEEAGESSNTGCGSSNCCSNVVNLFQSQRGDQELYRLSLSVSLMTARKRSLCMFFNNFGPFFRHFQLSEMRRKKLSK